MSNQSVSNEGKDRTDENVVLVAQESRVESDLPPPPPPPPLDPSSSSSSFLPPISHDPSQVISASKSASINLISAQFAQVFSLVGRLSSENEALQAQVALHSSQLEANSSSIALLSSENEELEKRDEEKEKTMIEMTRAFGSWVWEAGRGEEKGRWLWSREKQMRASPQVFESKPPPSLDSLPVELFNSVTSLLGRPEHLALCQVSFNLLGKSSSLIYPKSISLGSKRAAWFVSSRTHTPLPLDNRISPLLLPSTLDLIPSGFDSSHFALLDPPPPSPSIPINAIMSTLPSSFSFLQWVPILQLLDPSLLCLDGPGALDSNQLPTTFPVTEEDLFFLRSWTRLRGFFSAGEGSVPVLRDAFALFPCVPRGFPSGGKDMKIFFASQFSDGRPSSGELLDKKKRRSFSTSNSSRRRCEDKGLLARSAGGGVSRTTTMPFFVIHLSTLFF